jgi:hypothetical protein
MILAPPQPRIVVPSFQQRRTPWPVGRRYCRDCGGYKRRRISRYGGYRWFPYWPWIPTTLNMANGDVLLDSDGKVILDADGKVVLDDAAGNACCCDPCAYCVATGTPSHVGLSVEIDICHPGTCLGCGGGRVGGTCRGVFSMTAPPSPKTRAERLAAREFCSAVRLRPKGWRRGSRRDRRPTSVKRTTVPTPSPFRTMRTGGSETRNWSAAKPTKWVRSGRWTAARRSPPTANRTA